MILKSLFRKQYSEILIVSRYDRMHKKSNRSLKISMNFLPNQSLPVRFSSILKKSLDKKFYNDVNYERM